MNNKGLNTALFIPWVCVLFMFSFLACSNQDGEYRLDQAFTCYNTNLGISFTVPKGWWIYDLNTANFSPDPQDTVDINTFDFIYEEDSFRLELINCANLRFPNQRKRLSFDISVESDENTQQNNSFTSLSINNIPFTKQVSEASRLRTTTLNTSLNTGYSLIITVNSRKNYKSAESVIIDILNKALSLE